MIMLKLYIKPEEILVGNLNILFLPWINQENEEKTLKKIQSTKSKYVMGHLELRGFRVNKHVCMEHGPMQVMYSVNLPEFILDIIILVLTMVKFST